MFHLIGTIPNNSYIAVSGGIDSMVALDFIRRGRHNPTAVYFNHGTYHGQEAEVFLKKECERLNVPLITSHINAKAPEGASLEDFWRQERYKFFTSFGINNVLTCHHLNDVAEWWIFSSLHGEGKIIPYVNRNVIRPFLKVSKEEIRDWAKRKEVRWIDDPSNNNTKFMRNLIRHELLPKALEVNPGLLTVLKKKIK